MRYKVLLTGSAARDLEGLDAYIAEIDSPAAADHVLGKIEEAVAALSESRSAVPIHKSYPRSASASTGKYSLNRIGSFIAVPGKPSTCT